MKPPLSELDCRYSFYGAHHYRGEILALCLPSWWQGLTACTFTATNQMSRRTSTLTVTIGPRSSGSNPLRSLEISALPLQNFGGSIGWFWKTVTCYWRNGMSVSHPNPGERVRDVHVTEDTLAVDLADGRTIIVPLAWYPRLLDANTEQRNHWKIAGAGYGIHWPDLDEDLSTEGLLRGAPAAAEPMNLRR